MKTLIPVIISKNVSHSFGSNKVLNDICAEITAGTITSVVGPSGCGKSVWFKSIAGIINPKVGSINIHLGSGNFRQVLKPTRHIGMVTQDKTIFPFWTAIENVAAGLMLDNSSLPYRTLGYFSWRKERKKHLEKAAYWLEKVGLKGSENKLVSELSGGMQQRVAIAQACINEPKILLMDEPFSALDEATREKQQQLLLTLRAENEKVREEGKEPPFTILIVTHEINEAILVGNRVIGLSQHWDWKSEGHESFPGAKIVYDKPSNVFSPYDVRNYSEFVDQKTEILEVVFNKKDVKKNWEEKLEKAHVSEHIVHTE